MQRDAAALAVVGLSQVDQLEVKRKGAGEQDGALHGQRVNQFKGAGGLPGGICVAATGLGIAAADGALAQRFNLREKLLAGLLAQHVAQQRAQRAHVPPQGSLFQFTGLSFELGKPLCQLSGFHKRAIVF